MATLPDDDDVEKVLTRIMSQNSPLLKQARTQGTQAAQQVGLGQSTMGIKAAQAAAYNAAIPIASQQAQQSQQTKLQQSQFGHETGMQTAGFQHAASQADLDRAAQYRNLEAGAFFDRQKAHELTTRQQNFEGYQNQAQRDFESSQNQAQRSMQERLGAMEISAADRDRTLQALTSVNNSWNAAMSQISSNENLPADVRNHFVSVADQARNHQYSVISSLMRAGGVAW